MFITYMYHFCVSGDLLTFKMLMNFKHRIISVRFIRYTLNNQKRIIGFFLKVKSTSICLRYSQSRKTNRERGHF